MQANDKNILYEYYFDKQNRKRTLITQQKIAENFTFRVCIY